jgi:hypothetical protein
MERKKKMAKNNQKNFITQQMQNNQNGVYWLNFITPDLIQRNTKRIVKEIVNNKYNYEQVGNYFLDPKFLDNLIEGIKYELEINTLYYNAVSYYKNIDPGYPHLVIHVNQLSALCIVYNTILDRLYMVDREKNIGYLSDLSALLNQYRNYLN